MPAPESEPGSERRGKEHARECSSCHVAAFGASSGGIAALQTLLSGLPVDAGIAYVVVMHLSPEHESRLVDFLQPSTRMPVRQVNRTVPLEPDKVFVIPPNANLEAIDTHLRLTQLEPRRSDRAPIDHFFRTMAASHDGAGVGVVLTGAGSDGTLGLRRIKERGGLTIAQAPAEAEYDSMPRNAIATGMVDVIASLKDIPDEIVRFCSTRPRLPVPGPDDSIAGDEAGILEDILAQLRISTGQELGIYRRTALLKRIGRRMRVRHVETLAAYLEVVRTVPSEPRALFDDLRVNVAEFFADHQVFRHLEQHVVPRLFESKHEVSDRVRVWSIGCSTGEEAYSLAMLLLEEAARRPVRPRIQVFASDGSEDMLTRARAGLYPEEVAAHISPERLARFFTRDGNQYRVREEVREAVVFATHQLLDDPPFSSIDLIMCRNVLRDFHSAARRVAFGTFAFALVPHGLLLLGPGETADDTSLFECRDENLPLYVKRTPAPLAESTVLRNFAWRTPGAPLAGIRVAAAGAAAAHARLREQRGPPSVLLDALHNVVHYSTNAGRYVRLPGGEPTNQILRLVHEPLRSALRAGLARVKRTEQPWSSVPLTVETDVGPLRVALRLVPDDDPEYAPEKRPLLLLFEELEPQQFLGATALRTHAPTSAIAHLAASLEATRARLGQVLDAPTGASAGEGRNQDLEGRNQDLEGRNQDLQGRNQDLQGHNTTLKDENEGLQWDKEELRGSNEDLVSNNEELRFVMEELSSSKEELEAANEELHTLDEENRRRLEELERLSSDLQNLLASTGIATVFLDNALCIQRFTPQAAELFRLRHADRGRPLADLTSDLRYPELVLDAERVLAHLEPAEREIAASGDRWFLARLLPYRTSSEDVAGIVLSLLDITARRHAEDELRAADRRKDEFLATLGHELRNPLAPIAAGIAVLRTSNNEPRLVEKITGIMDRQTQQLVRLVDDLLEVSRVTGGRLVLKRAPIDLGEVVQDAVAASRPLIDAAGHELTLHLPDERIEVEADSARLTQVLVNLLSNAARYTPQHGHVWITVRRHNGDAVVAVKDDGIGIPHEMLGKIFEMFTQLDATSQTPASGLGIGLTLARSLVELHGGTLHAKSEGRGRGSEFTVRLPLAEPAPGAARGAASAPAGNGPVTSRSILVIDDNADAAQTLAVLLKALGHGDVRSATSGQEGLAFASERPPETMIVDLRMPGMSGFEVARRVRAEPWGSAVVLVALSGWGQEEHRRRASKAGFDHFLTKPVDSAGLAGALALRAGSL